MTIIEELDSDDEYGKSADRPWEREPEEIPAIEETPEEKEKREARWKKQSEEESARVQAQFDLSDQSRAEAKAQFSAGRMEDAIDHYNDAIRHLYKVGNKPDDRAKAEKANLTLHLNLALANLKLEDFEAAKDQASSAWAIDQENVKALYRRGLAQAGLARKAESFLDSEAKAAVEDFQACLRIEPSNADARRELQKIRAEMRVQHEASTKDQKEFYGNMFGGKTEGEDIVFDETVQMVRPIEDPILMSGDTQSARHIIIKAEGVEVGRGGSVLSGVDLNFQEKWCVGIYSKDDATKAAFVDVLTRKIKPSAGKLEYPKKKKRGVNPDEVIIITTPILMAVLVGAGAIIWAIARSSMDWYITALFFMLLALTVPLVCYLWYEQQCEKRPPIVIHMKCHGCKDWAPKGSKTVKEVLAESLPKAIKDRDDRAFALLRAAGMDKNEDRCLFKDLSEDQKQVVYCLRQIVVKSKVIIVDNAFRDLVPASQSRMLRMLKRVKQDCSASILFISSDVQQLTLVCDSLGLLSGGKLCEMGPTDEVLARPRHDDMKKVIEASNDAKDGSSLKEDYDALLRDTSLAGRKWLPKDNQL